MGRSVGDRDAASPVRVALVDDHAPMRAAVRVVLGEQSGVEVVGEAETIADAIELITTLAPNVLLLDIALREGPSLPAIPTMLGLHSELAIVVLTMHAEPSLRRVALAAGASGFVLKDGPPSELVGAIHAARPSLAGAPRSA